MSNDVVPPRGSGALAALVAWLGSFVVRWFLDWNWKLDLATFSHPDRRSLGEGGWQHSPTLVGPARRAGRNPAIGRAAVLGRRIVQSQVRIYDIERFEVGWLTVESSCCGMYSKHIQLGLYGSV